MKSIYRNIDTFLAIFCISISGSPGHCVAYGVPHTPTTFRLRELLGELKVNCYLIFMHKLPDPDNRLRGPTGHSSLFAGISSVPQCPEEVRRGKTKPQPLQENMLYADANSLTQ